MNSAPHRAGERLWANLAWPALAVVAGILLIASAAALETQALSAQMWSEALVGIDCAPLREEAVPIAVREVAGRPFDAIPKKFQDTPEIQDLLSALRAIRDIRLIEISLPDDAWNGLIGRGRLPERGKPEVIAGDLARPGPVTVDGVSFQVVGRLRRSVSGLTTAYILPKNEAFQSLFSAEAGAKRGWIDPEGMRHLGAGESDEDERASGTLIGGATRSDGIFSAGVVLGLLLVACGGAALQVRWLRGLARRWRGSMLRPVLSEMERRPSLLWAIHGMLYGLFFLFILLACMYPRWNAALVQVVSGVFEHGGLSDVGAAYRSGHIFRAAASTFHHNFLVGTVAFTIAPSLFIPCAGLLKSMFSFALAGFAVAPIWIGSAWCFTYHSITMVLELEAYIVASFVACVLPIRVADGIARGGLAREYLAGLGIMASGALLAGAMLAVAAFYEATTLILFR